VLIQYFYNSFAFGEHLREIHALNLTMNAMPILPSALVRMVNFARAQRRKWVLPAMAFALAVLLTAFLSGGSQGDFVAHEWGTFTSVQGGEGALLNWRPLETSSLPNFVYDWRKPGLNRLPVVMLSSGKGGMTTLQRMETPVIYFYSKQSQSVDVSVKFPQGLITEWYPQADQIGPASVPKPAAALAVNSVKQEVGAKPSFDYAPPLLSSVFPDSRVRWAHVEILAETQRGATSPTLPIDAAGNHYFAARETDANCLQVNSLSATNPMAEHEKFIFYRGAGSFATPLTVTMDASGGVELANTGPTPLKHLFVLGLEKGAGKFLYFDQLKSGEHRSVRLDLGTHPLQLEQLSSRLGEQVASSLVESGLYRREAAAMVKTWKDSWFAEDGVRVLYVLPRDWTDQTLPLTLAPAPRELVRVMVGRAEILAPQFEQHLAEGLRKAEAGDAEARALVLADLKKLGRFAEPAISLAIRGQSVQVSQTGLTLLQASATPASPSQSSATAEVGLVR
jgi:hypothetical protein